MSPNDDLETSRRETTTGSRDALKKRIAADRVPAELIDAPESVRRFVNELRLRRAELAIENERLSQEQTSSQTPHQSLFQLEPVAYLTIGLQSFILQANESAARLLRVSVQDLTRSRLLDFILATSQATYEQSRTTALETGEPQTCEVQILRRGSPFWAQLDFTVVRDPDSGTRLCTVAIADISDRRRARDSMARLAALVESSSDAIFSRDMLGRLLSWNRGAQALLGYNAEEILGQSFHILVPHDQVHEEARIQNRIRHGETVSQFECTRVRKDGTMLPVSITVSPIYGKEAQIVGISEIARDIRDEKRAHAHMREQMHQLDLLSTTAQTLIMGDETDSTMWQLLVDRMCKGLHCQTCCTYIVDDDPVALKLAAAAIRPQDQFLPARICFADTLSGQVAHQKKPLVEQVDESLGAEAQALAGMNVHSYAGFPLMAHGTLLGVVAFGTQRSRFSEREVHVMQTLCDQIAATLERGRLIGELRAREVALKDADRRKDDFIATLAHELRNPLAPIRNAAVALRYSELVDPKFQWCRDVIERQVGIMANLLEDLLDVSRITRRRIELRLERVDLARIVSQAVETVRPLMDEMGHRLAIDMPDISIIVNGDPTRLTQVLGNLLNNAAKYTERSGTISLTVAVEGREAVMRVTDSGIGIAAEHLPKVFELFSQVEAALTRSRGGIGVGLSLTKALVDLHGGRVAAASEGLGKGSQFSIYLPVVEVSESVVTRDAGALLRASIVATQTGLRRVLVVDDNVDAAKSLESVLQGAGYDVRVAHDGEHAVQLAEIYRPHVVLLDIGMPDMNGYEICRRMRQQPWSEKVLIIACTGWGRPADRALAREAGFDHHLVKPADPENLLSLIGQPELI